MALLMSYVSTFPTHISWEPDAVLPCYCCKLELVIAISLPLVAHSCNCYTSKFDSSCAYRSGEIHVLRISQCSICFPWASNTVCTLLFSIN